MDVILFWIGALILVIFAGGEIGGALSMIGKDNRSDDPPLLGERLWSAFIPVAVLVAALAGCWLLSQVLMLWPE